MGWGEETGSGMAREDYGGLKEFGGLLAGF